MSIIWQAVTVLNLIIVALFGWITVKAGRYTLLMGLLTGAFVFFTLYHLTDHLMGLELMGEIFETGAILFLAAFVYKKFMEGI